MHKPYPADIFRAYDIRGDAAHELSSELYHALGQSIGTLHQRRGGSVIYLGLDGRLTSPAFAIALRQGLTSTGATVINLGLVPTAVVYHAAARHAKASAVIVTASHNPACDNGLKYHLLGETQTPADIQTLYQQTLNKDWISGHGSTQLQDYVPQYIDDILQKVRLQRRLHVIIDTGHGVAGVVARQLFESLGCRVDMLYETVDGHFPAHHPDPSQPENMRDLQTAVLEKQADLGLALDGDGDRLGAVSNDGRIIWPDELMLLFAKYLLPKHPGARIIFDVKSTNRLAPIIREAGGIPIMWKTGHSLLRLKLQEERALLAGELSGHIFFQNGWYGFDDGLYAGARLIELISQQKLTLANLIDALPPAVATPEIKIPVAEADKANIMASVIQAAQALPGAVITSVDCQMTESKQRHPQGVPIQTLRPAQDLHDNVGTRSICLLDGLRIDYDDGFGLIRASQTTPHLTLRFEAVNATRLEEIQREMMGLLEPF